MKFLHNINKTFGGALLVGGTALGAGMLALPVVSGEGGLFPSVLIFILCYLFSIATGLLFLEICLWMPQDANIISMASHLLGKSGKVIAWILYLFLFYTLTIAYVSGGGEFVVELSRRTIPSWSGILLFTAIFGTVVYLGTKTIDRVNFILMVGLVVSFFVFVAVGLDYIDLNRLTKMHFSKAVMALPVMFSAFSYQGVIPSLNTYLDRDPKKVKIAILAGTSIPFVVYIIWEILILGIVPLKGDYGLISAKAHGWSAVQPLSHIMETKTVAIVGQSFAFFALTTSFLGVTLGLLDFLADGLQVKKTPRNKAFLCLGIYVPPMIIGSTFAGIFLKALGYAGGIGCVLLLGFYPALMVWVGRYKKDYPCVSKQLFGEKWMLLALFIFIALEISIEILQELF